MSESVVRIPFACLLCKSRQPARLIYGYLPSDRAMPSVECETCKTRYTIELTVAT